MDKKEIKSKVKDVLVEILDCFLGVPENIFRAFDRQEAYKIMRGNDNYNNILSVSNLSKLFFRLKRSGYIEITKSDTGESIRFTNKARLAVVDRLVDIEKWDGKYRFVSFDIPERLRINRDRFRRSIKKMGFIQLQKSLWVNDKNVGQFIELASREYAVDLYVIYITAENSDVDETIKSNLAARNDRAIEKN